MIFFSYELKVEDKDRDYVRKYFGVTRKNIIVDRYNGSSKPFLDILKSFGHHGLLPAYDVTERYCRVPLGDGVQFYKEVIHKTISHKDHLKFCRQYSIDNDIVNDPLYSNLQHETGCIRSIKGQEVFVDNVKYDSIREAARQTGVCANTIRRRIDGMGKRRFHLGEVVRKNETPVTIDGRYFKSVRHAEKELGFGRTAITHRMTILGHDLKSEHFKYTIGSEQFLEFIHPIEGE